MQESPSDEILTQAKELQKKGRYLDAWVLLKDFSPPEDWPTTKARLTGAKLIERLGDNDRASRIYLREWRHKDSRREAHNDVFWEVLQRRGAFLTWRWLHRHTPAEEASDDDRGDHQAHLAIVLTKMRDFDAAEECLKRGEAFKPDSDWFQALRADILQEQDRREEALKIIHQVVEKSPDYVSAIRIKTDLLIELGRDEEAIQVLRKGLTLVQASNLATVLVNILIEMGRYEEASAALDFYESLIPLADISHRDWLHAKRCDIASHLGDVAQALQWAEKVERQGFYKKIAERLRGAHDKLRKHVLPVPFIRQHHNTCAPASVTSIALYWGQSIGHLELADEICYDGTPDYRERNWAETHGWSTREFKVTMESAKLLLDQGMPFMLTTVYPGGAHAQVVMGYDEVRTVFLIRDPGNRHTNEFLAAESLDEQTPFGPRGFVMVPQDHQARLTALTLPDAEVYDLTHELSCGLSEHDRPRALTAMDKLRANYPDHQLRWHGELVMARYDGLQSQALSALEKRLDLYPTVENWVTERLLLIRDVHGREAMIAALHDICREKASHPIHWRMLARELHWNDRHRNESLILLKRVHRRRVDAIAILTEANVLWNEQRYEEATELYRLAACLEDKNEEIVMTYFRATKWVRQTDAALTMMRRRFELDGRHSGQPGITLYRALEQLSKDGEAIEVLEESLKRRPNDADHALFVAGEYVLWNRVERVREILNGIHKSARSGAWHRVKARLAQHEGDGAAQLHHYRMVLEDDPLDTGAHRAVAYLLDLQVGIKAGYNFLQKACSCYPFHWQLHVALLDWAKDEGVDAWEAAIHELIRIDGYDGWARRELANVRRVQRRYEDAHAELDLAAQMEAASVALHTVRGSVYEDQERFEEALAEYRAALAHTIDNGMAMRGLIRLSQSHERRIEALEFIQLQLRTQVTQGDAVTEFVEVARATLADDALEKCLREGWAQRPDLWQTGVLLAEHLRNIGKDEEAIQILKGMSERFPLMPRIWLELAFSLEANGDRTAAIAAAMKIRELNPAWSWGMRMLSEMIRKTGDYPAAQAVLEEAVRHRPNDALNHGWLAEVLWNQGKREEALKSLTTSVEKDPGYNWAWDMLAHWGKMVGRPHAAREAAKRLQSERPGESRTWMIYADLLTEYYELDERLAILDKAMELDPHSWRPADMKARVLALAGRFESSLNVCQEHSSKALELQHRRAWVLYQSGKYDEAVRVMNEALEKDPSYPWPWQLLAEWHQHQEKLDLAEKACRQLTKLQPTESSSRGFLGSLLEAQGKKAEAMEAYREALELAPDYHYGFQRLFHLHLEKHEWDEVVKHLEAGERHFVSTDMRSRWFLLHARRRHWASAQAELKRLLHESDDDPDAFKRVLNEMEKMENSHLIELRRVIEESLQDPECNVEAGSLYVGVCKLADRLPSVAIMQRMVVGSECAARAYKTYIYQLGDRWEKSRSNLKSWLGLREKWRWSKLYQQHQEWFHSNRRLYGAVSYMLYSVQKRRELIRWLHDWQERTPPVESYILNNLVLCLQETGQEVSALKVIHHGMTLPEHNSVKMRFHIWAAMHALLEDRIDDATAYMDAVVPESLNPYGKDLLDIFELILAYQRQSPPPFVEVKARLIKFIDAHSKNPVMQSIAMRTCRLIGLRLGSVYPMWWLRLRPLARRFPLG